MQGCNAGCGLGGGGERMGVSGFVEDERDAAHDQVAGRFSRLRIDEVKRAGEVVGAQADAAEEQLRVAKGEALAMTYSEDGEAVGRIGQEGVVVAVEEHGALREEHGVHGQGVVAADFDGHKALPGAALHGGLGARCTQDALRDVDHAMCRRGPDVGLEHGGVFSDHRDVRSFLGQVPVTESGGGEQIGGLQTLRGHDAVGGLERQMLFAVQKAGEVGLPDAGLTRQQGDADRSPLYPAEQFQPKTFVHLGKVHVENPPPAMA